MKLTALKRLREVFSFWGKAAEAYADPEEFVINLNACIQAIRNVTFALQSQKSEIDEFDLWYAAWVDAMKKDRVMRWCVDARNTIVKQSDLETKSVAVASIHNNYLFEPSFKFEVSPIENLDNVAKLLMERISKPLTDAGYLRIERQWVVEELENVELLSALAHAFTVLVTLINDLKDRNGPTKIYPEFDSSKKAINPESIICLMYEHSPECMKAFEDYRTEWFSFPDLRPVHVDFVNIAVPESDEKAAKARYGNFLSEGKKPESFRERIDLFANNAKHILEVDGYHMTVLFMFDARGHMEMIRTTFNEQSDKYVFWQRISKRVKRHGITELFFIGEAWTYSMEDKIKFDSPEHIVNKKENLCISGLSKYGECINIAIPFYNQNGKCILGEPIEDNNIPNFFAPINKIWGKGSHLTASNQQAMKAKVISPQKYYLEQYEPGPKMPCLCGSGQKFKKCCSGEYRSNAKDGASEAYNAGKYSEALNKCRLHLTWYILCHRAHTIPFLESEKNEAEELFETDIKALAYQVNLLMSCYEKTGKHKQFPSALDALSNAVTDQRWYDYIAYYRALWQLFDNGDHKLVYHELKKITDIESIDDVDILTLYLQVRPAKSFEKTVNLIDRIISLKPDPGIALQYRTLKGVQYFLIQDLDTAKQIIADGIYTFKEEGFENASDYDLTMLAQSLHTLGEISGDISYFTESQKYYKQLLTSPSITASGVASVYGNLGYSLLAGGNPTEAKEFLLKSLNITDLEITKVFLGRCYLCARDLENAEKTLSSISIEKMDDDEKYDYAVNFTILALETGKTDLLAKAGELLTNAFSEGPIFTQLKSQLLSEIERVKEKGRTGILPKILELVNRYVLLQPNIAGLGLNLNSVLDM